MTCRGLGRRVGQLGGQQWSLGGGTDLAYWRCVRRPWANPESRPGPGTPSVGNAAQRLPMLPKADACNATQLGRLNRRPPQNGKKYSHLPNAGLCFTARTAVRPSVKERPGRRPSRTGSRAIATPPPRETSTGAPGMWPPQKRLFMSCHNGRAYRRKGTEVPGVLPP
jgi:hypothetical protein